MLLIYFLKKKNYIILQDKGSTSVRKFISMNLNYFLMRNEQKEDPLLYNPEWKSMDE